MGWLFPSNKKITKDDFKDFLREIPELSNKEREYIIGVFSDSLKNGLTKGELEKEIRQLKKNSDDIIESSEIEKIKERMMEEL